MHLNDVTWTNLLSSDSSLKMGLGLRDRSLTEVFDKSNDNKGLGFERFSAEPIPLCCSIRKFWSWSWNACCWWIRAFCNVTASKDAPSWGGSEFIFAASDASWLCQIPGVWAANIWNIRMKFNLLRTHVEFMVYFDTSKKRIMNFSQVIYRYEPLQLILSCKHYNKHNTYVKTVLLILVRQELTSFGDQMRRTKLSLAWTKLRKGVDLAWSDYFGAEG